MSLFLSLVKSFEKKEKPSGKRKKIKTSLNAFSLNKIKVIAMGCPDYNKCPTIKTLESLGFVKEESVTGILVHKYCGGNFTPCPQYKALNEK